MGNHILINIFSSFLNMKLLILLIAIGVAQSFVVPAVAKTALNTGCKGVITILCACLDAQCDKLTGLLRNRRVMGIPGLSTVTGLAGSVTGVAGGVVGNVAGVAGSLTGAAIGLVIAPIKASICNGLVIAIKSAAASIGIVNLPSCATDPIKKKCESMVDGLTKKITGRRTLLRRLNALSRELNSF